MAAPSVVISAVFDEKNLAGSLDRAVGKSAAIKGLSGDLRGFEQQLDRANRRVLAFGASASIVYGTVRAFKALVATGIEVEKSLSSINSIFQLTSRELDSFGKDLFNVARQTSQSFRETAKAAEEFSRQGLTAAETAKRTRDAMLLVRLTGLETTKAVDLLTAAMNTFGKTGSDTTKILNQLVAVDQRFAVSAKDIANAIARAGSVIDDSNVSLEQFSGLVTAARQITSRDGATIGNSLKTIFTRLERSTTLDQLEALGVAVRDASGNARNALDVFKEVADSYRTLNREQQNQVAELGAGVYQINQFKALLLDLGKANGIAAQATNAAANATNEALIRNAALNDTLASSIQNLQTSATQAAAAVGELTIAPTLGGLVKGATLMTDLFANVKGSGDTKAAEDFGAYIGESVLKGLGNVLAGPGSVYLARALGGAVFRTAKDAIGDVRQAAGFVGPTGRDMRQPELTSLKTVNALLDGATAKERARFIAAKTVADQEAIIVGLLDAQIARQAKLAGQAASTGGAGLRGGASGRFPRAAGGFLPEALSAERSAINAGVGGAPASARPVYLPGFNRGNGQRGIVANSSEWMVPGAAGGAIYNREMIQRFGLPPGATPVAAGGFVPNAAGGMRGGYGGDTYDYSAESTAYLNAQMAREKREMVSMAALDQARRLAEAQRQRDMEKGFQLLEKERKLAEAKRQLTEKELQTTDKVASAVQTLYTKARARGADLGLGPVLANSAIAPLGGVLRQGPAAPSTFGLNQSIGSMGYASPIGPSLPPTAFANQAISGLGNVFAGLPPNWRYGRSINPGVGAMFANQAIGETGMGSVAPYGPFQPYTVRQGNAGILTANRPGPSQQAEEDRLYQLDLKRDQARFKALQELRNRRAAEARFQRLSRTANGVQLAGLAGSFGAAFLPEGEGGTARGQTFGALGGGLQGAGIGAGLGAIGGPIGTIVGAAVGGLGGAVMGFISKSQKSFEELARAIEEANSKSARVIEGASQFLGFQGNIKEAIDRGRSSDVINNIFKQQQTAASGLPSNVLRKLIDAGFDEEKQAEALSTLSATESEQRAKRSLLGGIGSLAGDKALKPDELASLADSIRGTIKGEITPLRGLGKLKASVIGDSIAEPGTLGHRITLDRGQEDAAQLMARIIGRTNLDDDQKQEAIGMLRGASGSQLFGLLDALKRTPDNTALLDIQQGTQARLGSLRTPLRNLLRSREENARLSSITDSFGFRVQGMRENASLQLGDLTESAALSRSGAFNLRGVERERAFFNRQALEETRTKFLTTASGLGSDPDTVKSIMGAGSAGDFEAILSRTFKGEETQATLREAVTSLKEIALQQDNIVTLTQEQNRIDQLMLESQQQQRLLNSGTFSADTRAQSASLFSRLGRSSGVAERVNAINASSYLTQIGLPQTDEGLRFERNARAASVRDNLAAVLSGRLGTKVSASDAGFEGALSQLGGRNGDDALASRVRAGLGALRFDPAAARKELLSGNVSASTLEQLTSSGQVSAGNLVLKAPLDTISTTSRESADILKRIETLIAQGNDITEIGKLRAELVQVNQDLTTVGPDQTRKQADLANRATAIKREIEALEGRLVEDSETALLEAAQEVTKAHVAGAREAAPVIMEAFRVGAERATEKGPSLLDTFGTGFTGAIESAARGPFSTVEEAMNSLEDVGARVGASLEANLGNAFGDFVTGAARGKDAFRSFVTSVLGDAARAFASKAVTQLLMMAVSAYTGSAANTSAGMLSAGAPAATATRFGLADGGSVPALLMGGEAVFSPSAVKRIGSGTLRAINNGTLQRRAGGGGMSMVRGGSGTRDDVPANLPPDAFVVRKAMVERYGSGFLAGLANGGSASSALITTSMGSVTSPTSDVMGAYRGFTTGGATASITATPSMGMTPAAGSSPVSISTSITINDQRTSATSDVSGGSGMDRRTAVLIEQRMRQVALMTIEEQQRVSGILHRGRS